MSAWQINYTKSSILELNGIYNYIAKDLNAPATANKQITRIKKVIDSLNQMPFRNPLVEIEHWKSSGLRKILVDNYSVFYIIDEKFNQIVIMHIFYSGRNISDILE